MKSNHELDDRKMKIFADDHQDIFWRQVIRLVPEQFPNTQI